jgi:hypothetical protein
LLPPVAQDKSLCEKIFPKLAEGAKLTKAEIQTYYKFKTDYIQNYDPLNENHEVKFPF